MLDAPLRVAQHLIGFIQLREIVSALRVGVGMRVERLRVEGVLQLVRIEPGIPRLMEQRKKIGHAAKLSPHEQCGTAFGFVTLNPPFCRSSLKSRTDPLTNNALFGSTTTRTPAVSTMMPRLAGPSTKSILYCNP